MTTATTSAATATTAAAAQTQTSVQKPAPVKGPVSSTQTAYKSEDYNGAPIVKLKLKQAGIMQYDPVFKLKLDSTEPTLMPLTPFFAARLNSTVVLCTE